VGASNWVHLDVDEILRETDAAFLVQIGEDEVWLPKSQIDGADGYEVGDCDLTISVTEWLARQKGLGD
jgi:hypothetical protein